MASFRAMAANRCMSNKQFVKQCKQGQKLRIAEIEKKENQYGGDDVWGISFKETKGFIRLSLNNQNALSTAYGDDTDDSVGKTVLITWRDTDVSGKGGMEIILTPSK